MHVHRTKMAGEGTPGNKIQVLAACLVSLFIRTSATSYTVGGDDYGWTTPTSDPAIYSKWAAGKTFNVGDILVFSYRIGHTVTEVTKADYDHCATTNPISTATGGPVSITIKTPGEHYFICTFPGHCGFGQKLAITAFGAAAATATNATSPSPTAAPLPATAAASNSPPTSTPSATPSTTPPPPPPASDVAAASHPPPNKSAGAVSGAGFLFPFLFVAGVFVLSAGYL